MERESRSSNRGEFLVTYVHNNAFYASHFFYALLNYRLHTHWPMKNGVLILTARTADFLSPISPASETAQTRTSCALTAARRMAYLTAFPTLFDIFLA